MLKGKRIVILGGSAGIGFAVAKRAIDEGAELVIASHSAERVEQAVSELNKSGAVVSGHAIDLRSQAAVRGLFDKIGAFDHLAFTAGEELLMAPLAKLDLVEARTFFELRFWGALAAVQAATPHLAKAGSIVLTGGAASHRPPPGFVIGAAICGGMEAVTRALALELAPVRVNIVIPGFVDTTLWSNVPADAKHEMFAAAAAKMPVGRVGSADDIAEHYVSFMRGRYTTGQSLIVDGGGVLV